MEILKYVRDQWDRVAAWVCITAGAVAMLLGWLGVSGRLLPAEQLPFVVSGGLFGLFLLGLGGILWLSADLRDEWRKLDAIEQRMAEGEELPRVGDEAVTSWPRLRTDPLSGDGEDDGNVVSLEDGPATASRHR